MPPEINPPVSQVKIQLSTRHADVELPEETGPLLVSTGFRRYALSTLVNNLLQTEKPIPFEFLINGQILRTSLDEFLTANGISSESTLNVEYLRALVPPLHVSSREQDAWISSVDVLSASSPVVGVSGRERIVAGGYDGLFRVLNTSSELLVTSSSMGDGGHSLAVKAVKFVSPSKIASSSMDRTIRIWNFSEADDQPTLSPALELYGHKASIDSLAVSSSNARILSASGDHNIGLWTSNKTSAPEAPSNLTPRIPTKRQKPNTPTPSKPTPRRGPLSMLSGHTQPATAVSFMPADDTVAYSTSWDHTLRTWDLPTGACVDARTTAHALLSVAPMPGVNLVAAGSSARHIALIDPRAAASAVAALTLRGHANAVVSLATDPDSAFGLVSGSHDGTCRIWDVRSVRAGVGEVGGGQVGASVYVIEREAWRETGKGGRPVAGEGVKVFAVCWDRRVGVVSGGEDKRVQINRRNP